MIKGRITEAHRTNFTVTTDSGEVTATVRGLFHAEGDFPKVGDYVSLEYINDEQAVIEEVLERKSVIKRKSADGDEEQIIAANVDRIFIVMGLDGDFNISRLERYLLLAEQSNVPSVIVLNKVDVVENISEYVAQIKKVSGQVPVLTVSALQGMGMDELSTYISSGVTAVLLGSSGAGKSTITNWLLKEGRQTVNSIRENDSRGRHTTTSRQLFALPSGGSIIDTPGMRELGVIESNVEDEQRVFDKIEKYAAECKFRNCDHEKSEGCSVLAAIEAGELTERELFNYHKLSRERAFQESKNLDASTRHRVQNQKRTQQKNAALQRQRLSRGLR